MPAATDVKINALSYVILYVKDTEKTKLFYRDTLGMKIKTDHPGWVELETGSTTLALHGEDKHNPAKQAPKQAESGQPIICFGVKDIYATYEALKAKGIKFTNEPQIVCEEGDQVGKSADFHDPDGNHLSIFGMVKK
jgi:catechol 2,3-dioxygenase-like lactoylglutathione lyase family enzyme